MFLEALALGLLTGFLTVSHSRIPHQIPRTSHFFGFSSVTSQRKVSAFKGFGRLNQAPQGNLPILRLMHHITYLFTWLKSVIFTVLGLGRVHTRGLGIPGNPVRILFPQRAQSRWWGNATSTSRRTVLRLWEAKDLALWTLSSLNHTGFWGKEKQSVLRVDMFLQSVELKVWSLWFPFIDLYSFSQSPQGLARWGLESSVQSCN